MSETNAKELMLSGLNLIPQAISIYDRDLRLVACNRSFSEMFELPKSYRETGAAFSETIRYLVESGEYGDVDDVDKFVQERVNTALAFEPHYLERSRSNGRTISIEGSPMPQGGWVTVYTDVTDIRRQEQLLRTRSDALEEKVIARSEALALANRELKSTNAALTEARDQLVILEERARFFAESTPAHIAHISPDHRYTYSNKQLPNVVPGRPDDIVGMKVEDALGSSVHSAIAEPLEKALAGQPMIKEFTDAGSGRRIRTAFTPDNLGHVNRGVHLLSIDVTQEVQARAANLQQNKRELAVQLISGLAHDFSNLLTIIMGLQNRLGRSKLDGTASELVKETLSAARRGGEILDRLSEISTPLKLKLVPTNLLEFLSKIETLALPQLGEEISMQVSCEGLDEPVFIDQGVLQDQLINLILNARDAIGNKDGQINLRATNKGEWLEVCVEDTGTGFSPDALERAFDPFFTTKGGEGSGLGLSTAFDQAKSMGGTIRCGNRDGSGAFVAIVQPLRFASKAPQNLLVVLVEDNEAIRQDVRELLVEAGHTVVETSSVTEARELTQIDGVGLLLSDITLPGEETGLDIVQYVQNQKLNMEAILMTSRTKKDPLRMKAEALCPVVSKPVGIEDIYAALNATKQE